MANIQDVATRAGVSAATVSRFLRGRRVRSEDAIRRAVEELGYWPTAAARSLRSGVHYAIAVVVPDVTNPFFAALVKGIESVFRPGPYSVFLANTDESSEVEDAIVADVVRRVDGIILAPATEQEETPLRAREAGVPVVFVDRELEGSEFDSVLVDNAGGAQAAAAHLVSLGHRRIGVISGPLNTTPGRRRHQGFVEELERRGVELAEGCAQIADFRESGGHEAMLRLLALGERPTAVFSANNLMTIGALKALTQMGVRLPDEMSLVGFDDLDLATLIAPALTVVERPTVEQGIMAAHLLQGRLAGSDQPPQQVTLPVRLIPRASSAPPSATLTRLQAVREESSSSESGESAALPRAKPRRRTHSKKGA
jgi:LacI family transcriptional regulator